MKRKNVILLALLTLGGSLPFAFGLTDAEKPASSETRKIEGLVACTIRSSAPPLSKDMANTQPVVLVDSQPIDESNNNWGPLDARTKDLSIGGWGDHAACYLRWELRQAEKVSKKVFLGFTLKTPEGYFPPEKVEIRIVTGGDNNPIRTGPWEPAKLHWSLAPSSESLVTIPFKEGYSEVDITEVVGRWVHHPERNFGFVISSTTNQKTTATLSDVSLRYVK